MLVGRQEGQCHLSPRREKEGLDVCLFQRKRRKGNTGVGQSECKGGRGDFSPVNRLEAKREKGTVTIYDKEGGGEGRF